MAQPLLHHRQHLFVVARLGIKDTVRRQSRLHQARREKVAARQGPENRARQPGRDAGDEQGDGGIIGEAGALAHHFMERRDRQPAAVQPIRLSAPRRAKRPNAGFGRATGLT